MQFVARQLAAEGPRSVEGSRAKGTVAENRGGGLRNRQSKCGAARHRMCEWHRAEEHRVNKKVLPDRALAKRLRRRV